MSRQGGGEDEVDDEVSGEMSSRYSEEVCDAVALGINEFLYNLGMGYTPLVAFERAVDGEAPTKLIVPNNVLIIIKASP